MKHYRYLIAGGGMAAAAAIRGIREFDKEGLIGVIGEETHPPYKRHPLTKGLWAGKSIDHIWLKVDPTGVDYLLGRRVVQIDPVSRCVEDDQGGSYAYERLLLATGGRPRRLPIQDDEIIYFRTFDDFQRLQNCTHEGSKVAVIGGGFIGAEIAAALAMRGRKVTMIFPEAGIGGRVFPQDLSEFLNDYYREQGVEVLTGELVQGLERAGGVTLLRTDQGREIPAEQVVAGLGILPNVELAQSIGLDVENGVLVDELLQTSQPGIYAAGDVAAFTNPALGGRLRVEHEDNALAMGMTAGQNMAGAELPYHHLPFFFSDLFDLGYEAVGELDSRLETYADWQDPFRKGVIYYQKEGRVRGVLLWNVWKSIDAARALIAEPGPFGAMELTGRIR